MRLGPSWEKKDKNCDPHDPADRRLGSWWDHVLIDTQSRLIVTLVIGRRTAATVSEAFRDFYRRTDGHLPGLSASPPLPRYTPAAALALFSR